MRIIFGDYNKLQTTIEDTDGSVSNVVQKNHTIEENHKVTQSDQQKLNLVDELNGLTEAKINSSSLLIQIALLSNSQRMQQKLSRPTSST